MSFLWLGECCDLFNQMQSAQNYSTRKTSFLERDMFPAWKGQKILGHSLSGPFFEINTNIENFSQMNGILSKRSQVKPGEAEQIPT
jgi:hypothetical protein